MEEVEVWDENTMEASDDYPSGGCVVTAEDPFDLDVILKNDPELYLRTRGEVVNKLEFSLEPLVWNGQETGKEILSRMGKFITVVSPRYVVVPNEWIASAADTVAAELGLQIHEDHSDERRLFRYYLDEERDVGPRGELRAGVCIRNSVDGSMAFSISTFQWRMICSNGLWGRSTVREFRFVHMTQLEHLDMGAIMSMIKGCMRLAHAEAEAMKGWEAPWHELPEGPMALDLIKDSRLPNTVRPPYLQVPTKRLQASDIPKPPQDATMWEIVNEVTDLITHSGVSERTRVDYGQVLSKALEGLMPPQDELMKTITVA